MLTKKFMLTVLGRAAQAAVQGYLVAWSALGLDFDGMVAIDNLKGASVGFVLSILMSFSGKPITKTTDK